MLNHFRNNGNKLGLYDCSSSSPKNWFRWHNVNH